MTKLENQDPILQSALQQALAEPLQRTRRLDLSDGRTVWLKRIERHSGRTRLLKGDGGKAIRRELAALEMVQGRELPIVPLLAVGRDYFVLADVGQSLSRQIGAATNEAFSQAGLALARLHLAGFRHGRPATRDICWNGSAIHFIDLENFGRRKPSAGSAARDLVVLFHSLFANALPSTPDTEAHAIAGAYRDVAPELWAEARNYAARLWWLGRIAALILFLRPKSRELLAVSAALGFFAQNPRP